jgi:hypothetical protein
MAKRKKGKRFYTQNKVEHFTDPVGYGRICDFFHDLVDNKLIECVNYKSLSQYGEFSLFFHNKHYQVDQVIKIYTRYPIPKKPYHPKDSLLSIVFPPGIFDHHKYRHNIFDRYGSYQVIIDDDIKFSRYFSYLCEEFASLMMTLRHIGISGDGISFSPVYNGNKVPPHKHNPYYPGSYPHGNTDCTLPQDKNGEHLVDPFLMPNEQIPEVTYEDLYAFFTRELNKTFQQTEKGDGSFSVRHLRLVNRAKALPVVKYHSSNHKNLSFYFNRVQGPYMTLIFPEESYFKDLFFFFEITDRNGSYVIRKADYTKYVEVRCRAPDEFFIKLIELLKKKLNIRPSGIYFKQEVYS